MGRLCLVVELHQRGSATDGATLSNSVIAPGFPCSLLVSLASYKTDVLAFVLQSYFLIFIFEHFSNISKFLAQIHASFVISLASSNARSFSLPTLPICSQIDRASDKYLTINFLLPIYFRTKFDYLYSSGIWGLRVKHGKY